MINSLASFCFITVFVIYLFHTMVFMNWHTGIDLIDKFILNGATFMTGFFVLSGFIMTHVYQDIEFTKRKNILNYYIKRFAKIYPIYIIGTIVYFIINKKIFFPFLWNDILRVHIKDVYLLIWVNLIMNALIASISYYFIEEPFRKLIIKKLTKT